MESQELQDEMGAIEVIYPNLSQKLAPMIYKFQIPQHEHITVQISFPEKYPEEKPCILDVVSTKPGFDESYLNELFGEVLDSIYNEDMVCIFDFFTELDAVLYNGEDDVTQDDFAAENNQEDHWNIDDTAGAYRVNPPDNKNNEDLDEVSNRLKSSTIEQESSEESEGEREDTTDYTNYTYDEEKEKAKARKTKSKSAQTTQSRIDPLAGWIISDPITDRKSTFVGFSKRVASLEEAENSLELLYGDKKVARANHVMRAWRIEDSNTGARYQDCDDDGETAAGGRLLHLLTIMDAMNVMVVVCRWFGGVHIGPDRFKHINSTAREAVVKGGFVVVDGNNGKKSKKKK